MKVTTISANVRYSKPMGDGAWKTIELGAEATLTAQEAWTEAQGKLYQELGEQLKALWTARSNGSNGNGRQDSTPDHYCQEHQTEFRRYEKEGRVWYAHKAGQKWCREKA